MKKFLGERGPQNIDEVGGVFEQFSSNPDPIHQDYSLVERVHNQRLAVNDLYNTHKHQVYQACLDLAFQKVLINTSTNEECSGERVL